MANLTVLPKIEKLSSLVTRILGCNPGSFRLQGTNSYLVGSGSRRILIDTSDPGQDEYTANLNKVLQKYGAQLQEIVITHWHEDHVGAVQDICSNILHDGIKVSKIERKSTPDRDIGPLAKYNFINKDQVFQTDGATLRVLLTPGHTEDHMSLYLEEENAVFAGDTVLGEGSCAFEDLYDYMKSLDLIKSVKPSRIYPGHGPLITDAVSKLTEYIEHRKMREKQIIDTLHLNKDKWHNTMELLKLIYTDIPETLYLAAGHNMLQSIEKLIKEGRIEYQGSCDEPMEMKFKLKLSSL
ncbi:endoribonuclease LACTB2-like [Tubulanus polymorphus]|uniref:endoribonuclease LACTB2-like n=1 Tax=Tubulanus polymorphus TaxID=672921 RepID=UPI003DA56D76